VAGVEAQLALARAEAELHLAAGGLRSLLAHTTRRARLADCGIAITPTMPAEIDVELADDGRLPVVLSLFSAPYVITRISPAAGLVLPAPTAERRAAHRASSSCRAERGRRPTRLTLLRLVATRPRSTSRSRSSSS
jgi:hypothetical protein